MNYPKKVLCAKCRNLQPYEIHTEKCMRDWNGQPYSFNKRIAVCLNCGQRVTVPGLDDFNETEFEIKCRDANDYIQVNDIKDILIKYDIDKRPLSKVLGLGEHTIENYLRGQLPCKRYSDMLRRVLTSYIYMQESFSNNKQLLNKHTAAKLQERLDYYEHINSYTSIIEAIALYILNSKYEITNLSLQKLLYYIEGFAHVLLQRELYSSRCEAWTYGPVYPEIYEKYKSFGRNQIQVDEIDLSSVLDKELLTLIDFVLNQFAIYNGVTLKDLSHCEEPWINAHSGYSEKEVCNEIITHEAIATYFTKINKQYDLSSEAGVKKYIASLGVI